MKEELSTEHEKPVKKAIEFNIRTNTWGAKRINLKKKFKTLTEADLDYVVGKEGDLVARLQTALGMGKVEVQRLIAEN